MKEKKTKRAGSRKPIGPQRKTEAKRLFDSKRSEIESQESLLLFLFVENYSKILTDPMIESVWSFMEFLKSNGYHIISEKEVFCVPFSKLVLKDNLIN